MMLINGTPANTIPATDRGLAYGDGVFRTLRVVSGEPLHWAWHYAKLAQDCLRLGIDAPAQTSLLDEARRTGGVHPNTAVKIIVTRGSGPRGYAPPELPAPLRVVTSMPYTPQTMEGGIQARLCQLRLSHQPALAGVKHLNRLENVLARAEWHESEIREGLLLDLEGNAIGGTMSNLFIAKDGHLFTPDLSRCGVAGVTRARVMRRAQRDGIPCHEANLSLQRVLESDELFLVSSLIGLWPVVKLDAMRAWPVGSLSRHLRAALQADDALPVVADPMLDRD